MRNYLYVSQSYDGWKNLGADEWFLENVKPDELVLFFYINENAVIIGRNQNPWAECDLSAMERDGVQLVRRITGGGAVYHDRGNLNFSFIAGVERYDQDRQFRMILEAVRALGVPCEFTGRNDLTANDRKFSGNAFCMRSGVKQHHGTLLINSDLGKLQNYLRVDPRKLRAKGTKSVRSRVCNLSELAPGLTPDAMLEALIEAYAQEYGEYARLSGRDLPWEQIRPYEEKHASWEWRLGQTPQFDIEIENRFAWGNVQLLLNLRNTQVESLKVFTDALDTRLPEEISTLLAGCRFGADAMASALAASQNPQVLELAEYMRAQSF
mgnify:CR=1 FL=1